MPTRSQLLLLLLVAGCRADRFPAPDPARLDAVARRYVVLGLSLGRHDPDYVDAYYGPDSLRSAADAESLSVSQVRAAADSLIAGLGDGVPHYADSLVGLRHRYLRTQLGAMAARARMLGGERLGFDQEAGSLYDVSPPHHGAPTSTRCSAGSTACCRGAGRSPRATSASATT